MSDAPFVYACCASASVIKSGVRPFWSYGLILRQMPSKLLRSIQDQSYSICVTLVSLTLKVQSRLLCEIFWRGHLTNAPINKKITLYTKQSQRYFMHYVLVSLSPQILVHFNWFCGNTFSS